MHTDRHTDAGKRHMYPLPSYPQNTSQTLCRMTRIMVELRVSDKYLHILGFPFLVLFVLLLAPGGLHYIIHIKQLI